MKISAALRLAAEYAYSDPACPVPAAIAAGDGDFYAIGFFWNYFGPAEFAKPKIRVLAMLLASEIAKDVEVRERREEAKAERARERANAQAYHGDPDGDIEGADWPC